jgi:hypothetical protein
MRYEFGPSWCSRPARWFSGAFCRDHHAMACGLREQAGVGCRPAGRLAIFNAPASVRAGDSKWKAGWTCRISRQCGSDRNRDISAALLEGVVSHVLFLRLKMSRWQIHYQPAATWAAPMFCNDMATPERVPDTAPVDPFSYFSIPSIDALRGASGRPNRPSQRRLARGERVYHGQQNDHRRLPPGGNPSGGPARQSSRGV